MTTDIGTIVPVLVATGCLAALSETVRWFLQGRGRAKVDSAKIVQGMALELLTPLHTELDLCRADLGRLRAELEQVLGYAIIAHALLVDDPRAPTPPPSVLGHKP